MVQSHKSGLLLAAFGVLLLVGVSILIPRLARSGIFGSYPQDILTAVGHPRRTYVRWQVDRETKAVEKLTRSADLWLEATRGGFTRTKPAGPDGRPFRASSNEVLPASVMPPTNTCSRDWVVVCIPEEWGLSIGTTNASGTAMEDFTLDVVSKIKACGVRRVTAYVRYYGDCWWIFDGETASRQTIDTFVKEKIALSE